MRVFTTQSQLDAAMSLAPLEQGAFRFAKQFGPACFVCADCGEAIAIPFDAGGTGYASCDDKPDCFVCYACCAIRDRAQLRADGKGFLYLTHERMSHGYPYADGRVSNWPGTLSLACRVKRGAHNIARYRYDVWFRFEGADWHGVQIGDNTQICRVRRLTGAR